MISFYLCFGSEGGSFEPLEPPPPPSFGPGGFYQKENAASRLKMWPVYSEDCGCCFISLLGELSEDKAKTKDVTEKLNIGLNSPLFLIRSKVVISVRVKRLILQSSFFKFDVSTILINSQIVSFITSRHQKCNIYIYIYLLVKNLCV